MIWAANLDYYELENLKILKSLYFLSTLAASNLIYKLFYF